MGLMGSPALPGSSGGGNIPNPLPVIGSATGQPTPSTAFYIAGNNGGTLMGINVAGTLTDGAGGVGALATNQIAYNGTTWDRIRTANGASNTTGTGLLGSAAMLFDGTNYQHQTTNSTATSGKFGADVNIISILGTAPTTAGYLNVLGSPTGSAVPGYAFYSGISDQSGKLIGAVSANTSMGTTGNGLLGTHGLIFDGTNYQKWYNSTIAYNSGSVNSGANIPAVGLFLYNGNSAWCELDAGGPGFIGDSYNGEQNGIIATSVPYLWNGSTFDRQRSNVNTTTGDTMTITSATTTAGATQVNYNARGAYVVAKLGTVTGTTPTLKLQFQYSFDGGSTWITLGATGTAFTVATGNTVGLIIYPDGAAFTASLLGTTTPADNVQTLGYLPRFWRVSYISTGTGTLSIPITACYVDYLL